LQNKRAKQGQSRKDFKKKRLLPERGSRPLKKLPVFLKVLRRAKMIMIKHLKPPFSSGKSRKGSRDQNLRARTLRNQRTPRELRIRARTLKTQRESYLKIKRNQGNSRCG